MGRRPSRRGGCPRVELGVMRMCVARRLRVDVRVSVAGGVGVPPVRGAAASEPPGVARVVQDLVAARLSACGAVAKSGS